jgi:hypothetical protein
MTDYEKPNASTWKYINVKINPKIKLSLFSVRVIFMMVTKIVKVKCSWESIIKVVARGDNDVKGIRRMLKYIW